MMKKSRLMGASPTPKAAPLQSAPPKNSGKGGSNMDQERRMRAEGALHTMTMAETHRKDRALMGDVKRLAKEKMRDMACVAGMKK